MFTKNYTRLKKHDFEASYLNRQALVNEIPVEKEVALKTYGAAKMNSGRFIQALFLNARQDIVEKCEVNPVYSEETHVRVETSKGTFRANHVIHTTMKRLLLKNVFVQK